MRRTWMWMTSLALGAAAPVAAQAPAPPRFSVEPYAAYGFFGRLPDGPRLEGELGYGGRVALRLGPQWSVFGNLQQSRPRIDGTNARQTVTHWSAGVEFAYVPRGGAEGMLPVLLEAGLGQARYENGPSDLAVKLGLASALSLAPRIAVSYGVEDYISNYRGDRGVVNQIFARIGVEIAF